MTDADALPLIDILDALDGGLFGVAAVDADFIVRRRIGELSDWLPPLGAYACDSPALLNLEGELARLRRQGGELALPSLSFANRPQTRRVTVCIRWNERTQAYLVVTTPDRASDQIDRLLASDRREKLMLRQQAEAAAQRLSVADALYRDIVESSGNLVLRFGGDLKLVFVNQLTERFLARPRDALIGANVATLFPGAENGGPWRVDMCANGPANFELAARDAKGALMWLDFDVRWIDGDDGGEFQASGRDATQARRLRVERERAAEAARAASVAAERLRIAHDLHDTLVRSIVTLIVETRALARKSADQNTRGALDALAEDARAGLDEARQALTQIRAVGDAERDPRAILARFSQRLREEQSIELYAEVGEGLDELPAELSETVARILCEALRNVELHSGARRVDVGLRRRGDALLLDIADDGVGFEPRAPLPDHYGLVGMSERAAAVGATLAIRSAPGAGVRLTLTAPLPRA